MARLLESVVFPARASASSYGGGGVSGCGSFCSGTPIISLCRIGRPGPSFNGLRMIKSRTSKFHRPRLFLSALKSLPRSHIVCEAQDTAVDVPAVTDSTWKSLVLESDLPVLVEFWAPWCGPCLMIHPVIDELSRQYAGKLKCYKLNTDESPSIANQYGIRSIPTVIVFKNGDKKDAIIGAVPKSTLTACIDKFL